MAGSTCSPGLISACATGKAQCSRRALGGRLGVRFGSSRGRLGACRHGTCGPPPGLPLHRPVHIGRLGSGHAPVGRCSAVHGNSQAHGGRGECAQEQNGPKMRFWRFEMENSFVARRFLSRVQFNLSADDPKTLESSMGWSEGKIDTDGDDIADETVVGFRYGVIPNSLDGSVWWGMPAGIHFSKPGQPGFILRYDPNMDQHEAFSPPFPGNGPRGIDVDTQGIIWTALGGSGHLARIDRKLCKQTWGRGDQCPEGWKLWRTPGPQFKAEREVMGSGSNDMHYYIWVDQFDTLGMGSDTVIINGTASDSLIAFNQKAETFTVIRVPYPLTTFTRGVDGRIDNPKSGWKGRGLWFTNGQAPIFQSEIPKSYAGKIQLRPSPLAH